MSQTVSAGGAFANGAYEGSRPYKVVLRGVGKLLLGRVSQSRVYEVVSSGIVTVAGGSARFAQPAAKF
jgi:hypothetical protein